MNLPALEQHLKTSSSDAQARIEDLIDFPSLFARQLALTPDNISMVFEDETYTYQDLDTLSEDFKWSVLQHKVESQAESGVTHSDAAQANCVGICIDKSPQAIAAMLGVLKAGATFVPLDPDYPIDRLAFMIEDASIRTIIAQDNHQQKISPYLAQQLDNTAGAIYWISSDQPKTDTELDLSCYPIDIKPSDLAYIMYTSGSTGKPKGVQIEHIALATYCHADIDCYKVTAEDRTLQFSTINFDIAIEEIFPPLLVGGAVVIRPSKRSDKLNELSAIINDYQVTAVHIATAYWHEWVDLMTASQDKIPGSLRLMVVTGEKVSSKHYRDWKTNCQLSNVDVLWCNAYGPTEATVSASVFIPDENFDDDNMPIGRPLKRYTAKIVDDNFIELPAGETGQLLIGGPALARGYLNRPELNEKAFIETVGKPDTSGETAYKIERMYKTGDLARWLPSGDIEFAGRIDHQIKIGSYRLEPGEIEAAINHYPKVLESLVCCNESDGSKTLVSYIAIGESAHLNNEVSSTEIRDFLSKRLPPYMVPTRYIFVSTFPKTNNGKIDRKALPDASASQIANDIDMAPPRNEMEKRLVAIWQEVLKLPTVGIHNDFFALGGSSLLAVGIVSRIVADLKLELPVRDFFANPTIATQARHINYLLNAHSKTNTASKGLNQDSCELRRRQPQLLPAYFNSGNARLFGMHYRPPKDQHARAHAVLICYPLGHEYTRAYRNLQQFALKLSQIGFDTFRFDYTGTGNSSGPSGEALAKDYIEDIRCAAQYIRQQSHCEKLSVIGLRMGATLAVNASLDNIEHLLLWDPVVKGSHYIHLLQGFQETALNRLERFRVKRQSSRTDQLYGYAMSQAQRESLLNLEMPHLNKAYQHRSVKTQTMICSRAYQRHEPGRLDLLDHCEHHATMDEIHWHERLYADSAFSSPQAFDVMMNVLKGTE